MNIQFIASVSVVARDPAESRKLYVDARGLPLEQLAGDSYASEHIEGSKHLGVWPLSEAAGACFGTSDWPADTPAPQVSMSSSWRTQRLWPVERRSSRLPDTRCF